MEESGCNASQCKLLVCVFACVCVHARILGVSSVHGIVINTLFINGTVTTGNIVPWR